MSLTIDLQCHVTSCTLTTLSLSLRPSACCEHPQLQSRDVELSEFMCSVTVSDPYLLTVELRPVQYSRTFKTSEHSESLYSVVQWSLVCQCCPLEFRRNINVWCSSLQVKFSQPDQIQVMEEDGIFTMNWSVPFVKEGISYSTELKILSHKVCQLSLDICVASTK